MLYLLGADEKGNMEVLPDHLPAGRIFKNYVEPLASEWSPMPAGASFSLMPEKKLVGIDEAEKSFCQVACAQDGKKIFPVAALLPQGYTRTLLPAFKGEKGQRPLPLLGYTAVAIDEQENFYVAAVKTDDEEFWSPSHFNTPDLEAKIEKKLAQYPDNRIFQQLAHCSRSYGCFTAQNVFYGRWEGGLPVSQVCNADCLGCISLQPAECCPSPQKRINFVPTSKEVKEVMTSHLIDPEAIISFGQGCEGEPSTRADLIAEAVAQVKKQGCLGTINMNTNAGNYEGICKIVDAGLDSIRVSMLSARQEIYEAYHRPCSFRFKDVKASLQYAAQQGVRVSVNMLSYPGLNDAEIELEAWLKLIEETKVDQIQIRNLNIDPDHFEQNLPSVDSQALGVLEMLKVFKKYLPAVEVGNYSRSVQKKKK